MAVFSSDSNRTYAIAVRSDLELFLFLDICRTPQGDVYVNVPRDHNPSWKPHSSYHASGQHHYKSFGHTALIRQRQKPDKNLQGTENITTIGIASDEFCAIDTHCNPANFQQVFEIPIAELRSEKYCTMISIDIAEPGGQPIVTPGAKIILRATFQDAVPWVLVTLFDSCACSPLA
jgi:hypothetical protein